METVCHDPETARALFAIYKYMSARTVKSLEDRIEYSVATYWKWLRDYVHPVARANGIKLVVCPGKGGEG